MHALIFLTTLFTLLAAALPATSNASSASATITFARNTQCAADDNAPQTHVAVSTACVAFPPGTLSLRVVGVEEGNKLRYNSLRVYNSGDCSGGWTLEPALTCAGQGGRGCACSQVGVFGSVRLVVD